MKTIEYALVRTEDGGFATLTHQDDEETPLIADSLAELIDRLSTWGDCSEEYIFEGLKGDKFVFESNSDEEYKIIRREVETLDLNQDDLAELAELRKEDEDERAKWRKEFNRE